MNSKPDSDHWLVRASTIRGFWIGGIAVLVLTVVAQLFIPIKGYFVVDGWLGFAAIFGFVSCVLMVIVAKIMGKLLKREEHYYDD
ncbi:MAG: hypothetical protein L3J24_02265 [Xanthomonadales bacterium]|nr:hypothetical protein [Xanthomonadales bacterium]